MKMINIVIYKHSSSPLLCVVMSLSSLQTISFLFCQCIQWILPLLLKSTKISDNVEIGGNELLFE